MQYPLSLPRQLRLDLDAIDHAAWTLYRRQRYGPNAPTLNHDPRGGPLSVLDSIDELDGSFDSPAGAGPSA